MKIIELLTEAIKARIDHPEDLAWQEGSKGIKRAMSALSHVATSPGTTSIKWDGSPALIMGRDAAGNIVITDKSGFGAKGYDGKARSQEQLINMLAGRKPGDAERAAYAGKIGSLWPIIAAALPKDLRGYYQGDLLWVGTPAVQDGQFVFKPNKIEYRVNTNSELGQRIASSKAGMVVHGFFPDELTVEPTPIDDVSSLQGNPQFLVLGATAPRSEAIKLPIPAMPNTAGIDQLLDPTALREKQLTNFGALVGRYMAALASQGEDDYSQAANGFIKWIDSSGESAKKIVNAKEWINQHLTGYNNLWRSIQTVANYKSQIKAQMDKGTSDQVSASLEGVPGHEGYVAATPQGKIKLVDRYKFMRK